MKMVVWKLILSGECNIIAFRTDVLGKIGFYECLSIFLGLHVSVTNFGQAILTFIICIIWNGLQKIKPYVNNDRHSITIITILYEKL